MSATATATAASKIALQLWPEQLELLLDSVRLAMVCASDAEVKAARRDLLDYLCDRAGAAAGVKNGSGPLSSHPV